MRDLFPGYYKPSKEEFDELWQNCVFSFDANILLHVYRYTPKTRERFFEILRGLKDRIFITHQAAYEYQKDRLGVISQQLRAYEDIQAKLEKSVNELNKGLQSLYCRHSSVKISEITNIMTRALQDAKEKLGEFKSGHPDLWEFDKFQEELTEILDGKVGEPYPDDKLDKVYQEADQRFNRKKPPGYKDYEGRNPQQKSDKYGDYILWHQLLEFTKGQQKSLILVTDARKEDWWLKHEGKRIGPRPELVKEVLDHCGVRFYMYTSDRFLEHATQFLKLSQQPETIEEAKAIEVEIVNYFVSGMSAPETLTKLYEPVRKMRGILKGIVPPGRSVVDELIQERRKEAASE